MDILENYPKHMPLQCNFTFKPYVQVFTELPCILLLRKATAIWPKYSFSFRFHLYMS